MTVTEPNAAVFTVTASGEGPLAYQWRRNGAPIGTCETPVRIMPLGDSITKGVYGSQYPDTRPDSLITGYRQPLYLSLAAGGYNVNFVGSQIAGDQATPPFDSDHNGYPGRAASWIGNNVNNFLVANPADVVLLHIGTNGVTTTTAGQIAFILDEIDRFEANAGIEVTVVLARIINRVTGPSDIAATTSLNNAVAAMAEARIANGDKIVLVDMENGAGIIYKFTTQGGDFADYLHPHDSGYNKMAALWYSALQGILPSCQAGSSDTLVINPTSLADNGAQFDVIVSSPYGSVMSTAATLTVNAAPANTPPQALDDAYTVAAGATLNTAVAGLPGILANDFDADNDPLTAVPVDNVINGTLLLNADGSFTYSHSGDPHVLLELGPGTGNSRLEYGVAAAIDGDTLVIGSNSNEVGKANAGAVNVYVRQGVQWKLQAKIVPTDAVSKHYFGWAVAIEGDTLVIGAPGDSPAKKTYAGAVYVYVRNGTSWTQQVKLLASDGAAGDEFGGAVAINGNTIVAGAYHDNHSGYTNAGSAYVFQRSGSTWSQQAKLIAADPSTNEWFGLGLAIEGDTIVVGALNDDEAGINAGAAYIYQRSGSTWSQQAKLTAADAAPGNTFGFAAALQHNTLVIGANGYLDSSEYAGAAYVFQRSGSTWTQQQKLTASDVTNNGFFGFGVAVAVDGERILVGANGHDEMGANAGAAYLFTNQSGTWLSQEKLLAVTPVAGSEFGGSVALDGNYAVLGANSGKFASQTDQQDGYAYVYQVSGSLTDSFAYLASDGAANSLIALVTISLEPAVMQSDLTGSPMPQ